MCYGIFKKEDSKLQQLMGNCMKILHRNRYSFIPDLESTKQFIRFVLASLNRLLLHLLRFKSFQAHKRKMKYKTSFANRVSGERQNFNGRIKKKENQKNS